MCQKMKSGKICQILRTQQNAEQNFGSHFVSKNDRLLEFINYLYECVKILW